MADEDAASSPATDQASAQTEGPGLGLAAALNAAFDEVGLGDESEEEPEEKVEPPEGEAPKEGEEDPGKPKEPQAPGAPKITAPVQWDAASKAKFDKLPDSAKSIVLDLAKFQERDYTRKTQELANERRFAQSVMSLITDEHREQMRKQGLNEVQGFERLLQYQDFALRKPAEYLRWFAQAANLRPQAIFPELTGARPAGQQQPTNGAVDPLLQLRRQVEQITGWANQSQRERQQEQQERQRQNETAAMSTIEQFRSAVDDTGQPLRPHMAQVEDAMTEILQTNRTINKNADPMVRLQKAYAMAVAQDEELSKLATEAAAARLRSSVQRSRDVAKAKAATAPINATAQVSEGSPGKLPLKDWVAKSMEEVLGH